MKLPYRKTPLALSIATAISLISLAACTTNETKQPAVDEKQPIKTDLVLIKDANKLQDNGLTETIETEQIIIDEVILLAPESRVEADKRLSHQPIKEIPKFKKDRLNRTESKILPMAQYARPLNVMPSENLDRENYAHIKDHGINLVAETPVSTFSIDVDTGAYTNVRRILNQGKLPPQDAIRAEEFINYFSYDFEPPADRETPFAVHSEMMKSPWSADSYLLQLGVKAWQPEHNQRPDANLVFLVDVSGSMNSADKLGLLKSSLGLLTRKLSARDRISIVVYAGASGIVLEPTAGNQTIQIEQALQRLQAGGSTNGAAGIKLAYQLAEQSFITNGINRILLATDGDFNVGTTNHDALMDLIEEKRKSGIALSTLGFGSGNYNDHLMEQLADQGNGQYSYIDSLLEARKVLVDEMNSSLFTVAGDVKIQLEFNPQVVSEYRLIGYENRALAREDFNNDKVDAGEIGAGHTVTALYEIRFAKSSNLAVDPLRYGQHEPSTLTDISSELGFLKLRYKNPGENKSQLIKTVLKKDQLLANVNHASNDIRFAASVAAFAQQLRGGKYLGDFGYSQIAKLAQSAKGKDGRGLRGEFLQLVSLAELLSQTSPASVSGGK